MIYNPLPTDMTSRAQLFAELETRYDQLANEAASLVDTINDTAASAQELRLARANLIGQGARKPQRLEYLEAAFLLQAPAEINGRVSTEAQRNAWVITEMQDSAEYKAFLDEHAAVQKQVLFEADYVQSCQNQLRLVYAFMSHLDAWIAFFAAPRQVPPAPQAPELPKPDAVVIPPPEASKVRRGGVPPRATTSVQHTEVGAATTTPPDELPF